MSQTKEILYTTGEIAKLCGVSVRTVQYYDTRGILIPSALSEGGRRLYSEEDLRRLKIICFLRELDIPISGIGKLLSEPDPASVIALLLTEQEKTLRTELNERQTRLSKLEALRGELKTVEHFTVDTIGDIARNMENKKKLAHTRMVMLILGILMELIEIGTFVLGIKTGNWIPFVIGMVVVIAMGIWLVLYYHKNVAYICPQCHTVFRPTLKEMFFASHTPRTRKLRCSCGHRGYCVETYVDAETKETQA